MNIKRIKKDFRKKFKEGIYSEDDLWQFIEQSISQALKEDRELILKGVDLIKLHNRAGDFLAGQMDMVDKVRNLLK